MLKKKLPGFEHVFKTKAHLEHYKSVAPNLATTFRVVFMCPTDKRRDSLLREAERQLAGKDPLFADCFRFVSKYGPETPLTASNFLFEPLALRCGDPQPVPLVRVPNEAVKTEELVRLNSSTSPTGQGGQGDGHPKVHVNA